jgi:hypothetical protein
MIGADPSLQRQTQLRELLAQTPLGQLRQHERILLPPLNGGEHAAPADPHHIAGDRTELAIGGLQRLLEPIDFLRAAG